MDTTQTPTAPPTRLLLVDDHAVVRSGLRSLIEQNPDLVVVGEAETAAEGIRRTELDDPDLVLMDLRLPDASGITACREITHRHPGTRVLILTSYADPAAVRSAASAGASGYLLKRVSSFDLISVIRRVVDGEKVFDKDEARIDAIDAEVEADEMFARLTSQERVIAGHISDGLTNREIAKRMGLAEKTVKNYVSHLLTKMGWTRRSEAAAQVARRQAQQERWEGPNRSPVGSGADGMAVS
jgi:DNA-binding NarL/FixJ family response regulator